MPRIFIRGLWAGCFILGQLGWAQAAKPLSEMTPQVRPLNPKVQVTAKAAPMAAAAGRPVSASVQIPGGTELTYALPPGTRSFSGTLVYRSPQGIHQEPDPKLPNRVRVQFLLDGKPVFDRAVDHTSVPEAFSVALPPGKSLTIVTIGNIPGDAVSLQNALFSPEAKTGATGFSVNAGEGYVNFMPEARQGMLKVYYPGESVLIQSAFGGNTAQATVTFEFSPEQGGPASSSEVPIPLQRGSDGIARGSGHWTVPDRRGPGTLRVEERVAGNVVYDRRVRIAIAPEVNLAKVADSPFGMHISSEGYLLGGDPFASVLGAKWGRIFLRWPIVEPASGQFDFSRADQLVDSYRVQNMSILAVLGADAPAWAGEPGPAYLAAWKDYVRAAVAHFRGRVDHWDVFNEVDVVYADKWIKTAPDADLAILKVGLTTVHETDPKSLTVCCSTGTVDSLGYTRRLFDAGLLPLIDIVSLHPYRPVAPDVTFGAYSYLGVLGALRDIITAHGGKNPIWSTEANWIIGPRGAPSVNAPDLDEHTQAEWVVRVNLMSYAWGIPYFIHMPYFYGIHWPVFVDEIAAYAQMTSWFSGASGQRLLSQTPGVLLVTAHKENRVVGALWAPRGEPVVNLRGLADVRWFDFYGNPLNARSDQIHLSGSPIYFSSGPGAEPSLEVVTPVPALQWRDLPPLKIWTHFPEPTYRQEGSSVHVTSSLTQWSGQFISPPVPVDAGHCYVIGFDLSISRGSLGITVTEKGSSTRLVSAAVSSSPAHNPNRAEVPFKTQSASQVSIVIAGANQVPTVTEFTIANPSIARCD